MSISVRSVSRGRQPFVSFSPRLSLLGRLLIVFLQSTGRGGYGNIRQPSESTDVRPESGPDDFSGTRGRELNVPVSNSLEATHVL
jgi:hypothetical protein